MRTVRNCTEILNILAFPHSNASCERVFSKVNNIKTKSRNRFITKTINGYLLAKECVATFDDCVKFEPNKDMLSRMTSANLYSKENPDFFNGNPPKRQRRSLF